MRRRLSWWVGVPLLAIAPILLTQALYEAHTLARWAGLASFLDAHPSILRIGGRLTSAPLLLIFWIQERLGLPTPFDSALVGGLLLAWGALACGAIRFAQGRRERRSEPPSSAASSGATGRDRMGVDSSE